MPRRLLVLLLCVVVVGCAVRPRDLPRSAHVQNTIPYLQANELDSFETAGRWTVDSVADPVQLSLSQEYVSSGESALRTDHFKAGAKKFMLHSHTKLNLLKAGRIAVDVYNDGSPGDLAIGFQTMPSYGYFETPRVKLTSGWNRNVSFDIAGKSFSSDASTYSRWLADRANVSRITLVFFCDDASDGTLYFDSLRFDERVADVLLGLAPTNLSVEPSAPSVPKYGKFELDVTCLASFQNVFDPTDIHVFATFQSPSGETYRVDGFAYDILSKDPLLGALWKVRFTPTETGRWIFDVGARNKFGEAWSKRDYFLCTQNDDARGFVRISRRDPMFFEFDNDEFFYPIGQNVAWSQDFEPYFRKISEYGGNIVRIWLCSWQLSLDIPKEPGKYNLDEARRVDEVIALAEQYGISVMLCLYTHGELTFAWDRNPMNSANGGPCNSSAEFFTHPEAKRYFRQRLSYSVARWGYSPNVFVWELGNEMDIPRDGGTDIGTAWMVDMLHHLRDTDPYGRLATVSTYTLKAREKLLRNRALDFLSPHLYRPDGPTAMSELPDKMAAYRKPWFVGEYGRGITADVDQEDPGGIALRGALWASYMSPAAGTPMPWWWDAAIEPNDLYSHFAAIAAYAQGEDRRGQRLRQVREELRINEDRGVSLVGLMNDHALYGYFYDEQMGAHPARQALRLLPSEAELRLDGFLDGEYFVEVWDTLAGKVAKSFRAEATAGALVLRLPAVDGDFAVKVKKTDYSEPGISHLRLDRPEALPLE